MFAGKHDIDVICAWGWNMCKNVPVNRLKSKYDADPVFQGTWKWWEKDEDNPEQHTGQMHPTLPS